MRKNQNRAVGKYYNKDNDSSHKRNRSHSLNKKKDICQSLIEDGEWYVINYFFINVY